jgi:hypothetical protein
VRGLTGIVKIRFDRAPASFLLTLSCVAFAQADIANAELRTGSRGNPYPDERPAASPTRPFFERVSLRYDTTAGTVVATIRFAAPLAHPSETSALRPWTYRVTLGDYFSTICAGGDGTWLVISGRLGDDTGAQLNDLGDFEDATPSVAVAEVFSEDRQEITLSVTDSSLVGLNLICSDASIKRDDDERNKWTTSSSGFLLDGFSPLDGEIAREAEYSLRNGIEFLDRDWGRPRKPRRHLNLRINCRRTVLRDTVSCTSSGVLRSVPGRPRITLQGRLVFPDPFRFEFLGPRWRYSMRGDIQWRRWPRSIDPPRRLIGKRCSLPLRWRGTRDLSSAVLG